MLITDKAGIAHIYHLVDTMFGDKINDNNN